MAVVDDDHSRKNVALDKPNPSHFTFWFRDHKPWKPKNIQKHQAFVFFWGLDSRFVCQLPHYLDAFKKQSKTNVALCISGKVMKSDEKCLVSVSCLARSCLKEISVPSSQTSKHQKHIMIYIDFPCFPKFLPHPTSPNHIKWSSYCKGFWILIYFDPWSFGKKTSPSSRSLNKLRVNWPQVSL